MCVYVCVCVCVTHSAAHVDGLARRRVHLEARVRPQPCTPPTHTPSRASPRLRVPAVPAVSRTREQWTKAINQTNPPKRSSACLCVSHMRAPSHMRASVRRLGQRAARPWCGRLSPSLPARAATHHTPGPNLTSHSPILRGPSLGAGASALRVTHTPAPGPQPHTVTPLSTRPAPTGPALARPALTRQPLVGAWRD